MQGRGELQSFQDSCAACDIAVVEGVQDEAAAEAILKGTAVVPTVVAFGCAPRLQAAMRLGELSSADAGYVFSLCTTRHSGHATSCHSGYMHGPSFAAIFSLAPAGRSLAADTLLQARCPAVVRLCLQAVAAAAGSPSLDGGSTGKGAAGVHSGALGPPLLRRPCVHAPGPHRRLRH